MLIGAGDFLLAGSEGPLQQRGPMLIVMERSVARRVLDAVQATLSTETTRFDDGTF
jgi:hypothetical protein